MKSKKIILWEILVPTIMDEKLVKTSHHKIWDMKVRAISSGLTILKTTKGEWISSDGELFAEKMIPVRIACSENAIEDIMDITIEHYKQEEAMAYKVSECVKFRKVKEDLGLGFMKAETRRIKKYKEKV